jgi:hypothetical protein
VRTCRTRAEYGYRAPRDRRAGFGLAHRSCSPPERMRLFRFAEKWIGTPWRQALCGLCCINKPDTIFLSIGGTSISAAVEADLIPIRNVSADDLTYRVIKKTEFGMLETGERLVSDLSKLFAVCRPAF